MCFRPSLTSVVERNIKEENELFQWRTELFAFLKGRKEPLSSGVVRWDVIGFPLREVSVGAKTERCLQNKKLMQSVILLVN